MSNSDFEKEAKEYPWDKRSIPAEFVTVQEDRNIPFSIVDWWNTRSPLFCCLFPFAKCYTGATTIDGSDPTVWKKQLEKYKNGPESMRGVWWLQYNTAHENLVTIFNETDFIGELNEDGTEGYGRWTRSLRTNWTRENTCFGHILTIFARYKGDPLVGGYYNLNDGILTLDPGSQWVYRVNDNEWWKIHYVGNIGEEGEQEVDYMYKWLKVIDKDGAPTEHWEEYVRWSKEKLPHSNCGTSWCTCWGCCLSNKQKFDIMTRPNPKQIIMFRE